MPYSGEGNLIEAVAPDGNVIPVVCDEEGKLLIDLSGVVVDVGEVKIEDTEGNAITTTNGAINVEINGYSAKGNVALFSIQASVTPVLLLAGNVTKRTFTIFNNSEANLYVKFAAGITSSFFNFRIPKNGYYESPLPTYSGEIWGMWDSATGTALVSYLY